MTVQIVHFLKIQISIFIAKFLIQHEKCIQMSTNKYTIGLLLFAIVQQILRKYRSVFHHSNQGLETSRRNRFLLGRMEETGKKVFLPVSSGRKWKKLEESGRNWKKYMQTMCMRTKCWKETPRLCEVILEHQRRSVFLKILEFCKVPLTCCPILMSGRTFQCLHIQATLWLHNQRYNVNFH